jgi:hypothetical protein
MTVCSKLQTNEKEISVSYYNLVALSRNCIEGRSENFEGRIMSKPVFELVTPLAHTSQALQRCQCRGYALDLLHPVSNWTSHELQYENCSAIKVRPKAVICGGFNRPAFL